jgi:hypothetical protein
MGTGDYRIRGKLRTAFADGSPRQNARQIPFSQPFHPRRCAVISAAMKIAIFLQACSLIVFSLSLTLSVWNITYQFRSSRVSQTERLHETWWTPEMMKTRTIVYGLCRELAKHPSCLADLVAYYESPLTTAEPPGRTEFDKLIGFFCNLEICLDSGVVDERLTTRLFAEAHYADYQPLIALVRDSVLKSASRGGTLPQWLEMTRDLERRFLRQGVVFANPLR